MSPSTHPVPRLLSAGTGFAHPALCVGIFRLRPLCKKSAKLGWSNIKVRVIMINLVLRPNVCTGTHLISFKTPFSSEV